ncbi:MAG: MucR family transcriptional regulator [Holosporales bacterium]|jgi:predicted transcriptional regulator|nr:MucR family transcriptional regulator [Holosporales bacterium]
MSTNFEENDLMEYTIDLAVAYLSNNPVGPDEIDKILDTIFVAVDRIAQKVENAGNRPAPTPAVPIEESVQDAYIVCLEDGKKLQMLKRHLTTVYSMTIEQYKERWGLPIDYPVVSPSYARRRSAIAKTTGLGSTGRKKLKVA